MRRWAWVEIGCRLDVWCHERRARGNLVTDFWVHLHFNVHFQYVEWIRKYSLLKTQSTFLDILYFVWFYDVYKPIISCGWGTDNALSALGVTNRGTMVRYVAGGSHVPCLHCIHTSCRSYPDTYSTGTEGSCPRSNAAWTRSWLLISI